METDFVPVMAFMASDRSKLITGQTISVDGGVMMVRLRHILDEGRIEIASNLTRGIHPEEVSSPRPGGILDPSFYPVEQIPLV